jgi:hypothetical protein
MHTRERARSKGMRAGLLRQQILLRDFTEADRRSGAAAFDDKLGSKKLCRVDGNYSDWKS